MENRPFVSIEDFLSKVKVNKPQMVNLIKSGAFDCFGDRIDIMHEYIDSISDKKKRLTLQNMQMLINFNLLPEEKKEPSEIHLSKVCDHMSQRTEQDHFVQAFLPQSYQRKHNDDQAH